LKAENKDGKKDGDQMKKLNKSNLNQLIREVLNEQKIKLFEAEGDDIELPEPEEEEEMGMPPAEDATPDKPGDQEPEQLSPGRQSGVGVQRTKRGELDLRTAFDNPEFTELEKKMFKQMMQLQLLAFTRLDATPQSEDPDPIYPEFNRVFKLLAREVGKSVKALSQELEEKEKAEAAEKQETDQTKGDDVDLPEPEATSPAPAEQTTTQQAPGEQK
jgi:hypothetical protein